MLAKRGRFVIRYDHYPDLSTITAPTLVIHGAADPMFPLVHAEALADEIPGATLLVLDRAGHGVDRADWDTMIDAIVHHTVPAARARQSNRVIGLPGVNVRRPGIW